MLGARSKQPTMMLWTIVETWRVSGSGHESKLR